MPYIKILNKELVNIQEPCSPKASSPCAALLHRTTLHPAPVSLLGWGCPSQRTRILGWLGRGVSEHPHRCFPLRPRFIYRDAFSAHARPSWVLLHFCLSGCGSFLAWFPRCPVVSRMMALVGPTLASLCCLRLAHIVPTASLPGGLLYILQRPGQMAPPKKSLPLPPEGYNHPLSGLPHCSETHHLPAF